MDQTHSLSVERPHEALREYPVVIGLPVEWGDQDSFGHVNNTVYLRWCETARVVYLERIGIWEALKAERQGPIVAALSCNYRRQVTFPDSVEVGTRVTKIGNSSFRMEHAIVSLSQNAVVAEADSTLVFFDYRRNQSVRLPDRFRQAIEKLEGRPFNAQPA